MCLSEPFFIIPFSLLVLLQLTQGEGEEHRVPHPQLSAAGAGPVQLLTSPPLCCRHDHTES